MSFLDEKRTHHDTRHYVHSRMEGDMSLDFALEYNALVDAYLDMMEEEDGQS